MIQFQVPQFIETEDKVVGPLSLRQFGYIGASAAISGILLFLLRFGAWILVSTPILGIGAALAFVKVNGRPVTIYIKALFSNIWSPSVYVFRPEGTTKEQIVETPAPKPTKQTKKEPSQFAIHKPEAGIKDLWQKMNTSKKAIPQREKALPAQNQSFSQFKEKFESVRELTGERETARRVDYR